MFRKIGILIGVLALCVGSASAATVTLESLLDGGSLIVDDKIFTDFSYSTSGAGTIDASQVNVTGLTDGGVLNPGTGIRFEGAWSASGGEIVDIQIDFTVMVLDPNFEIIGSSLFMGGGIGADGGVIDIAETQCAGGVLDACVGGAYYFLDTEQTEGIVQVFDSNSFDPAVTLVDVFKDVLLDASNIKGVVQISRIDQRFIQRPLNEVPEPATMLLFSSALLGLGLLRKKKLS